jgi:hypothetical protein
MSQNIKENIENFYEVLHQKGLVELTKSEKEKLMKKALEYHKSSQDEKLTRMIELLYYKKDFTLNSFTAWKIDKEEKDTYLFKSFDNLQSLEVMLNRGFTAYTSNKKELMGI